MNRNIKKKDILLEIYNENENELTPEKLKSFFNNQKTYDLYISSFLIKSLIKDNKFELLKIIFDNLKFYDDEFIKWLLFQYKNKESISVTDLNQEISNDKNKIKIDYEKKDELCCRYTYNK